MGATHLPVDRLAAAGGETVHVIATSVDGTREALETATALARGLCGRVVLFLRRGPADLSLSDQDLNGNVYTPRPNVLPCVSERAIDVVQLFQSPGLVVIGGEARLWWPTAEQRLAQALTRLGCHVTFVHVPHRRFVQPFIAAARERARQMANDQLDNAR